MAVDKEPGGTPKAASAGVCAPCMPSQARMIVLFKV